MRLDDTWRYWRAPIGDVVEVGLVRGVEVALPVHFHQEDQITLVLSGTRSFVIGDDCVHVGAGEQVRIPAGTPHRSLSSSAGVVCLNLYVRPEAARAAPLDRWGSIAAAAQRAGMSREGFSRRFKKLQGVSPQEFRLLDRLNDARQLLRDGAPIATAAADAGFADQSHLGRCFRRFFGVTPGLYRSGLVTPVL